MTGSLPTVSQPVLSAVEAQLFVTDINASCAFFTEKLGFTIGFIYGEPAFYAQVRRDRAALNLRLVRESVFVGDIREREELLAASMTLDRAASLEQLFVRYREASVDFFRPLKQEPWGARTFIVRDPDGNLLLFAGPAT
jgi:catechol 2,3-dioxygenase-like lactoylglutathione lyase family enzyme